MARADSLGAPETGNLATVRRLYVLDPVPAWRPASGSLAELGDGEKHHLVDPAGRVATRYAPQTTPERIRPDIERLLAAAPVRSNES